MKIPLDLSLYLITDRTHISLEKFFNIIQEAIEGGVTLIQLREKNTSFQEVCTLGTQLLSLLKPYGIPLIINDHIDVALAIGAAGVHLGQSDANVDSAKRLLGSTAIIGLSIETLQQAKDAENQEVDYIAASPVFATLTKTDCKDGWGIEGLKSLCSLSSHPVVAIGGIHEGTIDSVLECKVAGVAVVSAIFQSLTPKIKAATLKKKMEERCL